TSPPERIHRPRQRQNPEQFNSQNWAHNVSGINQVACPQSGVPKRAARLGWWWIQAGKIYFERIRAGSYYAVHFHQLQSYYMPIPPPIPPDFAPGLSSSWSSE